MAAHRDRPAPLPVMGPERRVPPADDRVVADADAGAEVHPVARRDRRPRAQVEDRVDRVDEIPLDDRIEDVLPEDAGIGADPDLPSPPEEVQEADLGVVADLQITDLVEQVEGTDAGVVADPAPPHAEERREADPHAPADAVAEQHPVKGDLEPGRQECQYQASREFQVPHSIAPASRCGI